MNCSSSGSSVLGISQARILEWVAISSSRGSEAISLLNEGLSGGKDVIAIIESTWLFGPCIFFVIKMITNLITNCPQRISRGGSREGRGWLTGKRHRGVIRRKEWMCLTEQITFSSQCWGLSNISMWKNMLFVWAEHPGKKQDTPSRIYLWLNQWHLKGIVFQTVLLMQESLHSSDHPEIRSKVV